MLWCRGCNCVATCRRKACSLGATLRARVPAASCLRLKLTRVIGAGSEVLCELSEVFLQSSESHGAVCVLVCRDPHLCLTQKNPRTISDNLDLVYVVIVVFVVQDPCSTDPAQENMCYIMQIVQFSPGDIICRPCRSHRPGMNLP